MSGVPLIFYHFDHYIVCLHENTAYHAIMRLRSFRQSVHEFPAEIGKGMKMEKVRWDVGQDGGRTSVSGQSSFAVLRSTCS